jgi:hypothetical protein
LIAAIFCGWFIPDIAIPLHAATHGCISFSLAIKSVRNDQLGTQEANRLNFQEPAEPAANN